MSVMPVTVSIRSDHGVPGSHTLQGLDAGFLCQKCQRSRPSVFHSTRVSIELNIGNQQVVSNAFEYVLKDSNSNYLPSKRRTAKLCFLPFNCLSLSHKEAKLRGAGSTSYCMRSGPIFWLQLVEGCTRS
jgi:hypothetical protein